jgi:hypothetical protein
VLHRAPRAFVTGRLAFTRQVLFGTHWLALACVGPLRRRGDRLAAAAHGVAHLTAAAVLG